MNYDTFSFLRSCRERHGCFYRRNHKVPSATFIDDKLFLNGDQDANTYADDDDAITISFRCLSRFMSGSSEPNYNYTKYLDSMIHLHLRDSSTDIRTHSKTSPGFGFTKIAKDYWHKPASVLFGYGSKSILLGIDDDQYFGVLLPETVYSIEHAYECLIPEYIRDMDFHRQGEWFFVKTDDPKDYIKEKISDSCYILRGRNDKITSNPHKVSFSRAYLVEDTLNINGGNPIPVFRTPSVSHPQHVSLNLKGWYFALENTSLQSYSEEGVD